MIHLPTRAQRATPWKNGGGTTTELFVFPRGAQIDDFDVRVSRARVETDGPFSHFAGVDRTLLVLAGHGMRLSLSTTPDTDATVDRAHPTRTAVTLTPASPPFAFAGDVPVSAALVDGPIEDLNVMTRRGRYTATITRAHVDGELTVTADCDHTIIVIERGAPVMGTTALAVGDAIVLDMGERAVLTAQGDVVMARAAAVKDAAMT